MSKDIYLVKCGGKFGDVVEMWLTNPTRGGGGGGVITNSGIFLSVTPTISQSNLRLEVTGNGNALSNRNGLLHITEDIIFHISRTDRVWPYINLNVNNCREHS